MSKENNNKIIKLNNSSIIKTDNRVTIFNKQIIKSSKSLASRLYEEAEQLTWRFIREKNYNGDKVEDAKNANDLFLKAIELNPSFQDALNGYAQNLRLTLKDYESAIEVYTKLIRLNPKYEYAYSRRGFCKRELNDHQGHLDDFNNSISIKDGEMDSGEYSSRGLIKQRLEDFKGVIDDLLEAIKLGKIDAFNYERLGKAYVELNDYNKSFEAFDKAIEIELTKTDKGNSKVPFPLLYRVFDIYISTLFNIENYKKASELVKQMQSHFPEKPRTKELHEQLNNKLPDREEYIDEIMD
jgi:tetratricopeptide (TPR) repeat protein